ncbi:MAG TPA: beta-ketoacyl-[acyl-carrier-protein] synthase family protein [Candidatus Acidoferrum sp.]|nr:beta-ketoacyl-[acyl-carrier-protein] synthase family protein [Candidatus Acidoferrum sp.]
MTGRRGRTVVVTGLGAVSPFGTGVKAFWQGITAGACAIRPITLIETEGFRSRIAAEVPGAVGGSARRARADRLALTAASEALDDARLSAAERRDAALMVGAVGGGMLEVEAWYWKRWRGAREHPDAGRERPGAGRERPDAARATLPTSHADVLSWRLGLEGPRETVVAACSSGAASIAMAADLIADGVVPRALAGGADALTRICYMGFNALRLLDPEPCRPFDRERRGMSLGEGAAFLVLEDAESARARGATLYAELAGHAMTTDAFHVTSPHPEGHGMIGAMREALASAGAAPADVAYVNAHGTGTAQNDRIEARALRAVFGEGGVLVSSTKSMIGHTMAAAGSLEALATVLAMTHAVVPPTVHLTSPDPDVPFDCVPGVARAASLPAAMSNSFGFGGQNVTLLFRAC